VGNTVKIYILLTIYENGGVTKAFSFPPPKILEGTIPCCPPKYPPLPAASPLASSFVFLIKNVF